MRITRETLLKIAKDTVEKRVHSDAFLLAAYLTGSLLTDAPFLGGTTDIDLVLVHLDQPAQPREMVKLSPEVHLDIVHRWREEFEPARQLRFNPWLAHEVYAPQLLYESQHFIEFTQAAVRSGFDSPLAVLTRAHRLNAHGRGIWLDLDGSRPPGTGEVSRYLKAVNHLANAVALLNGPPLPERRFLMIFPSRAEAAGRPHLAYNLLSLLGGTKADVMHLNTWLPQWHADYTAATFTGQADARIHPARLGYYREAFTAMMESDDPSVMLWPLLRTWTLAAYVLGAEQQAAWRAACEYLGVIPDYPERLQRLDEMLDEVEELIEGLATSQGIDIDQLK